MSKVGCGLLTAFSLFFNIKLKKMKNDWKKIKTEYINSEISLVNLAKKYNVSKQSVFLHSSKEKWQELKAKNYREIEEKLQQKTQERVVSDKVAAINTEIRVITKVLKVSENLLNSYLQDIESGKKVAKSTAYNIEAIMKTISNAQKAQRLALGIDDKVDNQAETEPEIRIIKGLDIDKI